MLNCFFALLLFGIVEPNELLIDSFYKKWDSHSNWAQLSSYLCENDSRIDLESQENFQTYYDKYIQFHINEQHLIFTERLLKQDDFNTYTVQIQYSALEWPYAQYHTICQHYNYTINININSLLNCIQSIQRISINYYFEDHNSSICYLNNINNMLLMNMDNNTTTETSQFSGFTFNFLDSSNTNLMIIGSLSCIIWTLFYIIYHIALLNYPLINYTKTAIFTLFLSSLANMELSIALKDPFSFTPNAISIMLSMIQFCSYLYKINFNFNAQSFSQFITFRSLKSNKSLINNFSNNSLAKYNPYSIPNRRKQLLYNKQQNIKQNISIKFDNSKWNMNRQSVVSDTSTIHYFDLNNSDNHSIHSFGSSPSSDNLNSMKYKSKVDAKYRGINDDNDIVYNNDNNIIRMLSMIFILICIFIHYFIIFITEIIEDNVDDFNKFNIFSALLLFQWMICLTFFISWFQNYRFEYAVESLLNDGYSLYYLTKNKNKQNINLNDVKQEMNVLNTSMHSGKISSNDINLVNLGSIPQRKDDDIADAKNDDIDIVFDDEEKKQNKMIEAAAEDNNNNKVNKCCFCVGLFLILILKSIRYLPWILLLNGCIWLIFGIAVCDVEIIWLQHTISVGVLTVYIICSFCMNEKHLILQKETNIHPIISNDDDNDEDDDDGDNGDEDNNQNDNKMTSVPTKPLSSNSKTSIV